jgi:hypothetical protein
MLYSQQGWRMAALHKAHIYGKFTLSESTGPRTPQRSPRRSSKRHYDNEQNGLPEMSGKLRPPVSSLVGHPRLRRAIAIGPSPGDRLQQLQDKMSGAALTPHWYRTAPPASEESDGRPTTSSSASPSFLRVSLSS